MITVTKSYRDLPAAHRQPKHDGHCCLIHGHNWGFDITFVCTALDANGFVVDVGRLGDVKAFLEANFDHTLLLNENDPLVNPVLPALEKVSKIVTVPNCSMEALAEFVWVRVNRLITAAEDKRRGLRCVEVVCWEDQKNRATYRASDWK